MDATKNSLNELLIQSSIPPVQLRVGADYGRLDFIRTGTTAVSEVNIVGFAANFAAKCEKYASAWEMVVGEELFDLVPQYMDDHAREHIQSPKIYQRNYVRREYRFHVVSWEPILPELPGIREQLAGNPTSSVEIIY